ncbi:circularly permuted type 2 ATP-grasp protein [Pseudomethylobacillus aquaticus]|uniref:Circularly permuted type 2 ATP-grasp protein n=1 Tax=Pseudomethylobacillus aquaticus TaxID=2676064 RepID=A0A3N0V198_9PROT|nr:circularly permuted type 2 ATP-grasp protein [Pseudomethylobacillus aquaticus]ROH86301.1 circularly permuted type 2 ATP-grasp protein [Pseudomethylobacillus aquaticus]
MNMQVKLPFDEMLVDGVARDIYAAYADWLSNTPPEQLESKRQEAELLFRRVGITFNVYGETAGKERLIPFDVVPRLLAAREWKLLSDGAMQRVRALNMFLHDIYHSQDILRAGLVPNSILAHPQYRPEMIGVNVPGGVYAHIAGIDIVRTGEDQFYVLEDNLRTPSGVSYMLEDRRMMMRLFPELFRKYSVAPVEHYPHMLLNNLRAVAQPGIQEPTVVLMTPGAYNSAYFEHAFIAQQMGVELVEGQDLFVRGNAVYMRTTEGPKRVDVIYRRIDDEFIDPLNFNPDSMLGVPGLMTVYRNGGVTLANAVGTGVADDKSTYIHVPAMIRFYLGEEPILNNVPTYQLSKPDELQYVLDHLAELVVKEVQGSGGYGMLVGPAASRKELDEFRLRILSCPSNYIAQPTLALSTCPTLVAQGLAPRHVDLRPFVLSGKSVSMVPGALCRVAMKEGSLVVNSSQGGGTKDTWVLN